MTWSLHARPLGTISPAPSQGSCQVQPLTSVASPSWSPQDPPPSLAVTSKLPSRAWLTVVVAQGTAEDLVPLRRLLRRCRLGERRDWCQTGEHAALGCPFQVPLSLSLVEVEPAFLLTRGRRNLLPPHSLGSCGGEAPGTGKGPGAGKGPNLTLPQGCGVLGWLGTPSSHVHPAGLLGHSRFEAQPALQPPPDHSAIRRALEGTRNREPC